MKRTRALILIASASLVSSCGGGPVDASEVITLVPEETWRDEERRAIASAGEAWNVEFGTRLRAEAEAEESGQSIAISLTDEGCMNERFQPTHARALLDPPEIHVCPETGDDWALLFETLRHELGHVLGIRRHAKNPAAVMAALSTEPRHGFQEEDRELFYSANPAFEAKTAD